MSSHDLAVSTAPATPEPKAPCEAAPLPPRAGYIDDDGIFYPGFDGDDHSECSDAASSYDVGASCGAAEAYADDDDVFVQKVQQLRLPYGATPARSAARAARQSSSTAAASPARGRRTSSRRPDIYSLRLMPAGCYHYTTPPAFVVPSDDEEPSTEAAAGDAGDALMTDVLGYDAYSHQQVHHHHPYAAAVDDDGAAVADPAYYDATSYPAYPAAPAAAGPSPAAAPAAPAAGVMCCYFKQGHCHMGEQCWYAHEGAAETPCHYGAKCRKGHRQLVRTNAVPPVPKEAAAAAARHTSMSAAGPAPVPKRYVHEPKPTKPSAPLVSSDMPCPHCSESGAVRLQAFPLFEGNRVRQATRGHCGGCLRTFMLA